VIAAAAALASVAAAQPAYRLVQVPTLGNFGRPIAISHNGTVLGLDGKGYFIWSASKGRIDIHDAGLEGEKTIFPTCVNDSGQVAGEYSLAHDESRAFIWYPKGTFRDIGTLGGTVTSTYGINNYGEVVGSSSTQSGIQHAFAWGTSVPWKSVMQDISAAFPTTQSYAYAVDSFGDVAGQYSGPATLGLPIACEWNCLTGKGLPARFPSTLASAVNDLGHVAGWNKDTDECFFWSPRRGYVPIASGFIEQTLVAMNDHDEVVGGGGLVTPSFLWTASAGFQPLQGLVIPGSPPISNPVGIDDSGNILAQGVRRGEEIIFILMPIKIQP
jgi:probable HAF family extracellular repeat protein